MGGADLMRVGQIFAGVTVLFGLLLLPVAIQGELSTATQVLYHVSVHLGVAAWVWGKE